MSNSKPTNPSQPAPQRGQFGSGAIRNNGMALANGRTLTEGREVRGGVGSVPSTPKPIINLVGQKPPASSPPPSASISTPKPR